MKILFVGDNLDAKSHQTLLKWTEKLNISNYAVSIDICDINRDCLKLLLSSEEHTIVSLGKNTSKALKALRIEHFPLPNAKTSRLRAGTVWDCRLWLTTIHMNNYFGL